MTTERRFERLERVKHQIRQFHPAGDTGDELALAMAWVRSLGHEAASLADDGFRYRSVYADGTKSAWHWIEPGEWLMHMVGDGQDAELDAPHGASEDGQFDLSWHDDWHETATTTPVPAAVRDINRPEGHA